MFTGYKCLSGLENKKIILASQSPRRKQLLEMAEINFEVEVTNTDETLPQGILPENAPEYLARKKAAAVAHLVKGETIIIAADTIVLLDNDVLGKPEDESHAIQILEKLSGRKHEVVTGVCILDSNREYSFSVKTEVYFRQLTNEQIKHYVSRYKPYDKAGAYAIQEWIGVTGIEKIVGDYYNVMGLPIGEVLLVLRKEFGVKPC